MEILLSSLDAMDEFSRKLVPYLQKADVIELRGDLGAGKTTFAQFFIKNILGPNTEVTSPTFNLVQLYEASDFTIWHFDLYRLKSAEELVEIGLDEALTSGVSLIEWPEIAANFLPKERLIIRLSSGKNDLRIVSLEGHGKWAEITVKMKNEK